MSAETIEVQAYLLSVSAKPDRHGDLVCRLSVEFDVGPDEEGVVGRLAGMLRSMVLVALSEPPPPPPPPLDAALAELDAVGGRIVVDGESRPVDEDGVIS